MKRKMLIPILMMILLSCMVTTVQAQSYLYKEVSIERFDYITDDEHWIGFLKQTMIVWSVEEGLERVTVKGIQVMDLYVASTGEHAARIKFAMTYTGTQYGWEDWCTGTYTMSWRVIPIHEDLIPEDDYDKAGSFIAKYVEGDIVWFKEHGEMWW